MAFDLDIAPTPTDVIYTEEPDFIINLEDQKVKVGDLLQYSPGLPTNIYGYIMDVTVNLGNA